MNKLLKMKSTRCLRTRRIVSRPPLSKKKAHKLDIDLHMTQNKAINNALQDLKKSHEETSKSLQQAGLRTLQLLTARRTSSVWRLESRGMSSLRTFPIVSSYFIDMTVQY
jgi:hypothetical protein